MRGPARYLYTRMHRQAHHTAASLSKALSGGTLGPAPLTGPVPIIPIFKEQIKNMGGQNRLKSFVTTLALAALAVAFAGIAQAHHKPGHCSPPGTVVAGLPGRADWAAAGEPEPRKLSPDRCAAAT